MVIYTVYELPPNHRKWGLIQIEMVWNLPFIFLD